MLALPPLVCYNDPDPKNWIALTLDGRSTPSGQAAGPRTMTPAIIPSTSLNPVVVPSTAGSSSPQRSVAVIVDGDKELGALIELLIERSGVSQAEISRRLGIKPQSLNQYKFARRQRPSIQWMLRLAHACGAKIFVEFGVKDLR